MAYVLHRRNLLIYQLNSQYIQIITAVNIPKPNGYFSLKINGKVVKFCKLHHFHFPPDYIIFTILGAVITVTYCLYQAYRKKCVQEKKLYECQLAREVLQAQIEVQNSFMLLIEEELQNEIGQLLSAARINLHIVDETRQINENRKCISQAKELISLALTGVHNVVKKIGVDLLRNFDLTDSLSAELIRIGKANMVKTELIIFGDKYALGNEKEIVLFCIFMQILSNINRESTATDVYVQLSYTSDHFEMHLSYNGFVCETGLYSPATGRENRGLAAMEHKAEVIGDCVILQSIPGVGTTLEVFLLTADMYTLIK